MIRAAALSVLLAAVYVTPMGQKDLVFDLLGAGEVIADCRLLDHSIGQTSLTANYQCRDQHVHVRLAHPSELRSSRYRTAQFAFEADPNAPPALLSALVARVRAKESAWRWTSSEDGIVIKPGDARPRVDPKARWETDSAVRWERRAALLIASSFPLSLLALVWLVSSALRRRVSRRPLPPSAPRGDRAPPPRS